MFDIFIDVSEHPVLLLHGVATPKSEHNLGCFIEEFDLHTTTLFASTSLPPWGKNNIEKGVRIRNPILCKCHHLLELYPYKSKHPHPLGDTVKFPLLSK